MGAAFVALAAAVLVFRANPLRPLNRRLALVLAAEGGLAVVMAIGFFSGEREPAWIEPAAGVAIAVQVVGYLMFLGLLESPLARPLRSPWALRVAVALVLVAVVAMTVGSLGLERLEPVGVIVYLAWIVVPLWGLAIAVSSWRRAARGTPARARGRSFALAFSLRDGGWVFLVASGIVPALLGLPPLDDSVFWWLFPAFIILAYVPVLAYGVLRHQILDIDLRIRWGIERGTVAATFVVFYIVGSQLAHHLLAPELGPAMGIVAAGLVVLALVPLQRAVERFAERLMPGVDRSPGYLEERRLAVYRAALADAYEANTGAPGGAEARLLARLREGLGIREEDHVRLERAMRGLLATDASGNGQEVLFGRFRVVEELGRGAMGRAVLVDDLELERRVVVKVIPRGVHDGSVLAEARALARVAHPNVLTIHEAREVEGEGFLVLEYAEGGSLAERIEVGPLSLEAFRRVAEGLLAGLQAVHDAGLVHRDVKPANVLLDASGAAKLADFGVAHLPGFETTMGFRQSGQGPVGTVRFMAPEQAKGRVPTVRSDLHAVGATLFEAVSGRAFLAPSPGETAMELQMRAARGVPYPAEGCGYAALDLWFERALAPAPEDRFPSARAMRDALDAGWARLTTA